MSDLPADTLTISGTEFSYTEVNYFTTAKHSKQKKNEDSMKNAKCLKIKPVPLEFGGDSSSDFFHFSPTRIHSTTKLTKVNLERKLRRCRQGTEKYLEKFIL